MPTGLEDLTARLNNPKPFIQRVLEDVCLRCVRTLRENTYGENMPLGWTFDFDIAGEQGTATVYHTLLESDRATWEVVFHVMNHGSRAHGPVRAKALHWIDKETGEDVFAKWVKGVKPLYFAEKCDLVIANFERTLQGKWQRWVNTGIYS